MSENVIFPGDKIAIIEEYESGQNTFDDGHAVRSSVVGIPELDKKGISQIRKTFKKARQIF